MMATQTNSTANEVSNLSCLHAQHHNIELLQDESNSSVEAVICSPLLHILSTAEPNYDQPGSDLTPCSSSCPIQTSWNAIHNQINVILSTLRSAEVHSLSSPNCSQYRSCVLELQEPTMSNEKINELISLMISKIRSAISSFWAPLQESKPSTTSKVAVMIASSTTAVTAAKRCSAAAVGWTTTSSMAESVDTTSSSATALATLTTTYLTATTVAILTMLTAAVGGTTSSTLRVSATTSSSTEALAVETANSRPDTTVTVTSSAAPTTAATPTARVLVVTTTTSNSTEVAVSASSAAALVATTTNSTSAVGVSTVGGLHPALSKTYRSISPSGSAMLARYCSSYPASTESYLLPPMFHSVYPQAQDQTGEMQVHPRTLNNGELNKLSGLRSNQDGEQGEYLVYCMFHHLLCEQQKEPTLVLWNFQMDNDNKYNTKKWALMAELPSIDLSNVNTRDERDFVVLVKDLGVVLFEVKATTSDANLKKAQEQLQTGKLFFREIMKAIMLDPSFKLPCVKVVVFPDEVSPSPIVKTPEGCHIMHKDYRENFEPKWADLVQELRRSKSTNVFGSDDFVLFTNIITGLWAMKPMMKGFVFNSKDASLTPHITHVDNMVEKGILSSDLVKVKKEAQKSKPITNVVYNEPNQLFRTTTGINLFYMTPGQKQLFDNVRQAVVRGHAGAGKSLLILTKIIEIARSKPNENIILVAPDPHLKRCQRVLAANQVNAMVVSWYGPPTAACDVTIMETNDFFAVTSKVLLSYNLSKHHIFLDDLQSYKKRTYNCDEANYAEIAEFINKAHAYCQAEGMYFWCALDLMQSKMLFVEKSYLFTRKSYMHACSLFFTNGEMPDKLDLPNGNRRLPPLLPLAFGSSSPNFTDTHRALTIPMYELTDVLRNTEDVMKVTRHLRSQRISKAQVSSRVLKDFNIGHKIVSKPISYHKLVQGTDKSYQNTFIVQLVCQELKKLLHPNAPLIPSSVAILTDGNDFQLKTALEQELLALFGVSLQTIEEEIETSNSNNIIYDNVRNVVSFECACVICVRISCDIRNYELYNLLTRARTYMTVIDADVEKPVVLENDEGVIVWDVKSDRTFEAKI